MEEADDFLLAFHRRYPGCTRIAFEHGVVLGEGGSSYELLASVAPEGSVLDLGCGDGPLLELLHRSPGTCAVGIDMSEDEIAAARARLPACQVVVGRAQALPFAAQRFDHVVSHLAFHLMSDLGTVVDEVARVLRPGGSFAAIIGGGPKSGDAFEAFLDLVSERRSGSKAVPSIGERRGRTEFGLSDLFAAHPLFGRALRMQHHYVDFGGRFDEVWRRLSTIYELMYFGDEERSALRKEFASKLQAGEGVHIPCTMAVRLVRGQRVETE